LFFSNCSKLSVFSRSRTNSDKNLQNCWKL
jgi:hypothetical protein